MATVDKIKNDLVRTINLMKKNIVLYQKADSDKQEKYKKIAVKLTKKKKQLEAALENGLESLYADAELDLNELRIIIRNEIQKVIINEVDVFGAAPTTSTDTPELEDAFNDLEKDIKRTDIDAPESEQYFGYESSVYLKKILNGEFVTIISKPNKNKPYTLGYYRRVIGKIVLNGKDINLEMIEKGMAWHFKKYQKSQPIKDRYSYNKAENEARKKNVGLWLGKNPLAPWTWRELNKKR